MRIFIITETLLAGGAEWFALRLCEALRQQNHEVHLFIIRPDLVDKRLTFHFDKIKTYKLPEWQIKAAVFTDRVLKKLFGSNGVLKLLNSRFLKRKIKELQPAILHSHLLNTDEIAAKANKRTGVRHITTIHGDYIQAIKNNDQNIKATIEKTIRSLDHIALISDEQISILQSEYPSIRNKLCKVYNGYPTPPDTLHAAEKNTFNFGLIARGIPQKGWEPAIRAFTQLKEQNIRLYLFGESEYLDQLKEKNTDHRIVFAGFSDNPMEAINNLDVGLLPSYYDAESLPTTIIEYLALNKPVITTTVGEIKQMLTGAANQPAGMLITELDPDRMVQPLYEAMKKLMEDKALYQYLADNCATAFEKFSMNKCVSSYLALYSNKKHEACVVS